MCHSNGKTARRTGPLPSQGEDWEGRGRVGPPGICTRRPHSGFGLYLKQNRKLSKTVSRGKTHSHLHFEVIPLASARVLNRREIREDVEGLVKRQFVWE